MMSDSKVNSEQWVVSRECEHKGTKHGVVITSNCTVETINVICDRCGIIVETIVET
ncbi:hypothetical protein MYRA21_0094 [Myroides sp. A21]|nr:hypothetical protein MYRA21_0094 [Myroides sp. A21]